MSNRACHVLPACLLLLHACGGSSEPPADSAAARTAPVTQTRDLCALLIQAEAEAILKKQPVAPQPQSSGDCWYGERDIVLHIIPVQFGSKGELRTQVDRDVKEINDKTREAGVPMNLKVEEVALSDGAFYDGMSLHVLFGRQVLTIAAGKEIAVAVAAKVISRW
jgi:hypothetical protein